MRVSGEGRGWLGVLRPNRGPRRAPPARLAGQGDPSPRGCSPYATRASGIQPAPRGGRGSGAAGRALGLFCRGWDNAMTPAMTP